MSLLTKAAFATAGVVVTLVVRVLHRRRARRVLEALDAGTMCVRCDSVQTAVEADRVRCETCGFVTSLSALRASKVSARDIDAMAPDLRKPR